jgi:hypothetical protein
MNTIILGKDFDFDTLLFRCHSLGKILTDPKGGSVKDKIADMEATIGKLEEELKTAKPELKTTQNKQFKVNTLNEELTELKKRKDEVNLSATVKNNLIDIWTSVSTGRRSELHNKYVKKGLAVEEDGITMLSKHLGKFMKKNSVRLTNDYLTGEMDTFEGEDILRASVNWDIKSNWDAFTFRRVKYSNDVNSDYYAQLQGYSDLNGAPMGKLFNALINTPDALIDSQIKQLWYAIGCPDESDPIYIEGIEKIKKNNFFDDFPFEERYHITEIPRNDEFIEKVHTRIKECRHWMKWRFGN